MTLPNSQKRAVLCARAAHSCPLSMTNFMFRIYSYMYEKILIAKGSVLDSMYRLGLVNMLVTRANTNGVWPNFLVWSPPWLYASSVKKLISNLLDRCLEYFVHSEIYIRKLEWTWNFFELTNLNISHLIENMILGYLIMCSFTGCLILKCAKVNGSEG